MRVKILLIATLIAVSFLTSFAQPQNGQMPRMNPDEMAKRQTERMTTDLNLNDKQKSEVAAININYAKKFSEIFQSNQGNREAAHAKIQEMNIQKNAELEKVLTAEQYKQFIELEKKRQEEHRQQGDQQK